MDETDSSMLDKHDFVGIDSLLDLDATFERMLDAIEVREGESADH